MHIKTGITVAAVGLGFCFAFVANGQSRDKSAEPARKISTSTTKAPARQKVETAKEAVPAPRNGTASATRPQAAESADEKAIRAGVELFTKSYAAHDAKAVAAHFTPNAEVINPDERVVKGRDAIEQVFANVFKTTPECTMEVDIESIRVLTPNLAIEEGVARTREAPNEDESLSPYVAIYSKLEGKWLLACVREWGEAAPELTPHDHLEELAWLVGDWVEESPQSVVRTSTTWSDNGNFLQQEFHVQTGGAIAMSGTVRIGWDAVRKQFKSWVFDSHGGHAEGYWLHVGGQWVIRSHGSTAAGEVASATNVYRLIDADTLGWRSYDRLVDGERQPDIDEIVVKRRPPAPGK